MKPEEAMQYQQQMAMQAGNQNQPFSERLNIDWDSLPWEIQAQIIQREGYQVAPEMFADKTAEEVLKEGAKEASKADAHKGEHNNDIRAGAGVPAAGGQRTAGAGGAPGNAGVSGRY
jgi:hypothetical protein